MNMIIVPIGIDCGLARLLQKYGLRHFSLPFDWSVSYGGVSKIIENNFYQFVPSSNNNINDQYSINFFHNTFPQDKETMTRRCNRLLDLLHQTEHEIIFFRKGHACHHHQECNSRNLVLENDIVDAENLSLLLKSKYPKLKYKIIVALVCNSCFDTSKSYESTDDNINIYNISTPSFDDAKFESLFKYILSKKLV